jgi:hypothetical protein
MLSSEHALWLQAAVQRTPVQPPAQQAPPQLQPHHMATAPESFGLESETASQRPPPPPLQSGQGSQVPFPQQLGHQAVVPAHSAPPPLAQPPAPVTPPFQPPVGGYGVSARNEPAALIPPLTFAVQQPASAFPSGAPLGLAQTGQAAVPPQQSQPAQYYTGVTAPAPMLHSAAPTADALLDPHPAPALGAQLPGPHGGQVMQDPRAYSAAHSGAVYHEVSDWGGLSASASCVGMPCNACITELAAKDSPRPPSPSALHSSYCAVRGVRRRGAAPGGPAVGQPERATGGAGHPGVHGQRAGAQSGGPP